MTIEEQIASFRETYATVRAEIGRVMVGQDAIVEGTLVAILAGGHVLLEGVPGLGKTLLVRTLSEVLELSFSRVQFTPRPDACRYSRHEPGDGVTHRAT